MKNVIITGSTRGIGFAMAKEFLKSGCSVTLSGRGQELPEETKVLLKPYDDRYLYVPCDVWKKESLEHLWALSAERWGTIDLFISNAGQNTPHVYAWETTEDFTEAVIRTNLLGMIYGCQVAASKMVLQGKGAIYSMEGLGSNKMIQEKTILYGTTKAALTYFMKGLAKELKGTGVTAGRLSPGMMLTDFITKMPDGGTAELYRNEKFRKIFNILADSPETVAKFLVPKMLSSRQNNAHIVWLTGRKSAWRFITGTFRKDRLI
jgi:NAD(P)-dependent dehydrogenase (short-subunit alcohol dehydrogenase family)